MGYIGPLDLVPPIQSQPVYWGVGPMERPIRTKFYAKACIITLNNIIKNYPHRYTGSGNSYISQVGILRYWAHGKSDSHQI